MNRTSAIRSLLNMAAFLSLTVGFVACQLGSRVLPEVPMGEMQGLDGGEPGALAGCITWRLSRCEITCGGDKLSEPLFSVSAVKITAGQNFLEGVFMVIRVRFLIARQKFLVLYDSRFRNEWKHKLFAMWILEIRKQLLLITNKNETSLPCISR